MLFIDLQCIDDQDLVKIYILNHKSGDGLWASIYNIPQDAVHVWSEDDVLNSKELHFLSLFCIGNILLEDKDCNLLTSGYNVTDNIYDIVPLSIQHIHFLNFHSLPLGKKWSIVLLQIEDENCKSICKYR